MIDFLKANPSVTKEAYLWEWTVPQIKLASYDMTHIEYLTEEQAEAEKKRKNAIRVTDVISFANDLGIPIFNK